MPDLLNTINNTDLANKALLDLEEQKKQLMLETNSIIGNTEIKPEVQLSNDELQALGDAIGGKANIVEEKSLEEIQKEVSKIEKETDEKVAKATNLTIDEVKKQIEDAYKLQFEQLQKEKKAEEEKYKKHLEELKMAQMTQKEKEEYAKLQKAKEEADKMSQMAELVSQLTKEREDQDRKIQEMQKKAKDIAFIRSQLKTEPWMADVVQSLKIETEEEYKKAVVLSEKIKRWKELEQNDIKKGSRNAFNNYNGSMSENTKKVTDTIKSEMDLILESVIIK